MNLSGEITLGNLLTAASVLVSAAALAYSWRNDRQLRRMEYADRIRRAAGITASVFDRWQVLVQQFFDGVQPFIVEVDDLTRQGEHTAAARQALVRGIYEQRAAARRRVAEERIESAYVDLYGYDPKVHALFIGAVERLREIDDSVFAQLVALASGATIARDPEPSQPDAPNARAGLGPQCLDLFFAHQEASAAVVKAFHTQMLRLIQASDHQIIAHRVGLATADEALPRDNR